MNSDRHNGNSQEESIEAQLLVDVLEEFQPSNEDFSFGIETVDQAEPEFDELESLIEDIIQIENDFKADMDKEIRLRDA